MLKLIAVLACLLLSAGGLPGVRIAADHDGTIELQGPPQTAQPSAPAAPPDSEIFLVTLTTSDGKLRVGAVVNITNSPGYDNQPSFTPDGREILFTSARGDSAQIFRLKAEATQAEATRPDTDIYRYDIAAKRIARVTNTPESEYSPAMTPDGTRMSVVRVEADSTQRLWSFSTDGQNPALVLDDIKPVGYYAWIDGRTLALFVLGQGGRPATLQIADTSTGKSMVAAESIGRSVQRMPSGSISFVQREPRGEGAAPVTTIRQLFNLTEPDRASIGNSVLVRPVNGAAEADLAWMPDGTLLMVNAETLYSWRSGDTDWTRVADLGALGIANATRLAVSPKGDRLAIVGLAKE